MIFNWDILYKEFGRTDNLKFSLPKHEQRVCLHLFQSKHEEILRQIPNCGTFYKIPDQYPSKLQGHQKGKSKKLSQPSSPKETGQLNVMHPE